MTVCRTHAITEEPVRTPLMLTLANVFLGIKVPTATRVSKVIVVIKRYPSYNAFTV